MSARAQIYSLMLLGAAVLLASLTALCWQFAHAQGSDLAQQRHHFLLQSLRKTAEDFLATGMTPGQMPAMQDVIDREKASFPQLMAIDIFSPAGRIDYSTDIGALGTQAPDDWVTQLGQSGSWQTQDPTQDQLGMRFENDLGRAAGGIVLTLQPATGPRTLAQWQQRGMQALGWLTLLTSCCLATLALTRWALHRCLRPYRQISRILRSQEPAEASTACASAMQSWAAQAALQLQHEYAQTQQTMQKLGELDRGQ